MILLRSEIVRAKKAVQELLDRMPDDCTLDDVLYHVYVLQSVEAGRADFETNETMSHEQVADALRKKWLRAAG